MNGVEHPAAGRWRLRPAALLLAVAAALIAYLTLVPLGYLAWQTFTGNGAFTLRFVREAYGAFGLGTLAWNSLRFALGSTAIAVVVGTLLAYVVVRTDLPARRVLFGAVLVPLLVPGVLYAVAWIFLAAPNSGALGRLAAPVLGSGTVNVFSLWGMICVEGFHLAPLACLLMAAAFHSLDSSLEESALASGASPRAVFRRITLPLVRPALSATVLIMAVRALESFEVPALLGPPARIWMFTSRVWQSLGEYPPSFAHAGAYALPLLVLAVLGVALHRLLSGRARSYQTVTGRGFRPRPVRLGRWRWPVAAAIAVYALVVAVLPLLILVYVSTQRFYDGVTLHGLGRMSLSAYRDVFDDPEFRRAVRNSLLLGVASATAVMACMSVVSWLVVRTKSRGRTLLDALAFVPIAIPGVVLGLALLVIYIRLPLPIYGTIWILLIAYCTRYMPYGIRAASISMAQISSELEESARASGAGWWQTFRRIFLPLLLPGLAAGWIYVFLASFRELSSSLLLYSPGHEVLPVVVWERFQNGQFPQLAALGVLMVGATLVAAAVAYRLSRSLILGAR